MAGSASRKSAGYRAASGRGKRRRAAWAKLDEAELMQWRLRDLRLQIEGSLLERRIDRLHGELERKGILWRPYVWLSTDWFTPDGLTGFAVPFYLAHPKLMRLEQRQMLEVEGSRESHCLRLLRHEAGHAIDNAYRLHRRKRWREIFGPYSTPYNTTYTPKPASRKYVMNLDFWYAQSHPAEDFAESFAVWLQPRSQWRKRYQGWPALKKLEYVDELMQEIGSRKAPVRTRLCPDSMSKLSLSLGQYYKRKKSYFEGETSFHDQQLLRLFAQGSTGRGGERAARFLLQTRSDLRRRVARVTGQPPYVIDQILNELISRCRVLGLHLTRSERETRVDAAILVATVTMSYLKGGPLRYQR